MFTPRTRRQSFSFNLDSGDSDLYDQILNNPAMRILSKKYATLSETTSHGEESTTVSHLYVYLEVEECHL